MRRTCMKSWDAKVASSILVAGTHITHVIVNCFFANLLKRFKYGGITASGPRNICGTYLKLFVGLKVNEKAFRA